MHEKTYIELEESEFEKLLARLASVERFARREECMAGVPNIVLMPHADIVFCLKGALAAAPK